MVSGGGAGAVTDVQRCANWGFTGRKPWIRGYRARGRKDPWGTEVARGTPFSCLTLLLTWAGNRNWARRLVGGRLPGLIATYDDLALSPITGFGPGSHYRPVCLHNLHLPREGQAGSRAENGYRRSGNEIGDALLNNHLVVDRDRYGRAVQVLNVQLKVRRTWGQGPNRASRLHKRQPPCRPWRLADCRQFPS